MEIYILRNAYYAERMMPGSNCRGMGWVNRDRPVDAVHRARPLRGRAVQRRRRAAAHRVRTAAERVRHTAGHRSAPSVPGTGHRRAAGDHCRSHEQASGPPRGAALCRRRAHPADRRSSIIELTTAGQRLLASADAVFEDELRAQLGPDLIAAVQPLPSAQARDTPIRDTHLTRRPRGPHR